MGCVPSKVIYCKLENIREGSKPYLKPSEGIYYHNDVDLFTKSRVTEAIRKRDLFLFQQVLLEFQIKPTELLSAKEHRKGVLHLLAEHNFYSGMGLIVDNLPKIYNDEIPFIVNARDSMGNTCLTLCVIHDAYQTLEALLKSDHVNPSVKNNKGQTALDIALEKESPCAKILSLILTDPIKTKMSSPPSSGLLYRSQMSTQIGTAVKKGSEIHLETTESPLTALESNQDLPQSQDLTPKAKMGEEIEIGFQSQLQHLLQILQEHGNEFIDEEFPHESASVVHTERFLEYFQGDTEFIWSKPAQFLGERAAKMKIFEKMEVNDVSRSAIAGCDVYSILSIMTEYPQRLLKLFNAQEINQFGAYSVNFFLSGNPMEVCFDDYIPCTNNGVLEPAFSQPKNSELWFTFLEKALAKLCGGYVLMDGLNIVEGFELLTGMPSMQYDMKRMHDKQLFEMISDWNKRNYLVSVGNNRMPGLTRNRHISVVNINSVNDIKMVKLRSQYGDDSWKWKFTEKTKKWSKDMKEKLGYFENEKDCYYLELSELITQFDFITVCFYEDDWVRNQIHAVSEYQEEALFELTVERPTEAIVSIHQRLPCFFDEGPDYDLSPVELIIAKKIEDDLIFIESGGDEAYKGNGTVHASEKVRVSLEEGTYVVYAKIHWADKQAHEFVFTTLSRNPIEAQAVNPDMCPDFLEKVFISKAERMEYHYRFSNECFVDSGYSGPYLWVYACNHGEKNWDLKVVFEKLDNLEIVGQYKESDNSLSMRLAPLEKRVGLVKRITDGEISFMWKFENNWDE